MADEQEALLAQIRALSGAIDQRRSNAAAQQQTYRGGGRGLYRGSSRGTWRDGAHTGPLPSRHRSLVISSSSNAGPPTAASTTSRDATDAVKAGDTIATASSLSSAGQEGWVKRKTTHNMSLVSSSTFEKTEQARLAANAVAQAEQASKVATAGPSRPPPRTKGKGLGSVRRGDNMGEVIIDGVTFEFDKTGTKLVKKVAPAVTSEEAQKPSSGASDLDATSADAPMSPSTPLRTSVNGQQFIRTKTGNLISQVLLDQRRENKRNSEKLKRLEEASKEIAGRQLLRSGSRGRGRGGVGTSATGVARKKILCAYFNKTGQCKNGLSCPYKHDMARVAICPRFLRSNGCPLPTGTCPLSHDPKDERVPHCVHYLATAGACRNGDACAYVHPAEGVDVTNASPICMNFSDFGWCSKGRMCPERHTWDCPEFLRKGKCDRRGCKLMHVVRVPRSEANVNEVKGARQLNDEELFIRDDDQTAEQHDENDEDAKSSEQHPKKRKRGARMYDAQLDEDEHYSEGSEEADTGEEVMRFKTRKSKAFSGQNDFISFDDLEGDDSEEEEEELVDEEVANGAKEQLDDEEASSVHSDSSDEEE